MKTSIAPLGELCDMDCQGLRPDNLAALQLPFVGVENVDAGTGILNYDTNSRVGSQKSTAFRFDERHVLYAKLRPYLNKVATPGFTGRCSTELVPLLPREGVDRDYVAHLLRRKQTIEYVMASVTGSRMPRTDMEVLMTMRVPLPPPNEQRRIVRILNRAAKIERLRAKAEERLREFIPALFIRMFGDPIENPMGWDEAPICDFGSVGSGAGFPKKEQGAQGKEFPFLKVSDMNLPGNEIVIRSWNNTISEVTRQSLRAKIFPTGSVVFPKVGAAIATNKKRMLICPSCVDNNVMTIAPTDMDSEFLFGLMLHKNLSDFASNADPPSMRKTTVESWHIPHPPLSLQRRYAEIIKFAHATTKLAHSGHKTTVMLNASLMSRLLGTIT